MNLIRYSFGLAAGAVLVACGGNNPQPVVEPAEPVAAPAPQVSLDSAVDRYSYALGMDLGKAIANINVPVKMDVLMLALQDEVDPARKVLLSDSASESALQDLLLRMQPKDWDLVLEVNLRSVFNYCKAFAPMMLKQRSGSIINTSSVVGVNGNAGQCNYSASKAGIIGFTKSLAKELGSRGIRCNAIAPGLIESAMTQAMPKEAHDKWLNEIPLRRGGTDLDIARTSLFLASDLSEYITGQVICVDGGVSL